MNIGFIGAGKVGFSLGKYFCINGLNVAGYYSKSRESAKSASEFTASRCFENLSELIENCDTVFITVPDNKINEVYEEIKEMGISDMMICHCSGSLSAVETFPDSEKYGADICSVHPLFPVSDKYETYKELGKAFFCIEGNEKAATEWFGIFRKIGNNARMISGECKKEYHAACAVFSNLVCALAAESTELMAKCGFSESEAMSALRPLAMSNMEHIFSDGPIAALTGPVERNDTSTIKKHIDCIEKSIDLMMYKSVSLKLTEVAEKKHPDRNYTEMKKLLS